MERKKNLIIAILLFIIIFFVFRVVFDLGKSHGEQHKTEITK